MKKRPFVLSGGKQEESRINRDFLLSLIREAKYSAQGARTHADFANASRKMQHALSELKDRLLLREDADVCWSAYREARSSSQGRRKQIQDGSYAQAVSDVNLAFKMAETGNPHDALKYIKEVQVRNRTRMMEPAHRAEIRGLLDRAWQTAIARIGEQKRAKERKPTNGRRGWKAILTDGPVRSDIWRQENEVSRKILAETTAEMPKEILQTWYRVGSMKTLPD